MKKVFFDTNIILDLALKREEYFEDAQNLFHLIDEKKISVHDTASAITDIYYIAKKQKDHEKAISFIKDLIEIVEVLGVDVGMVRKALTSNMKDFEDAVQSAAASSNHVGNIVTRNKRDFTASTLMIFTPKEFLNEMKFGS